MLYIIIATALLLTVSFYLGYRYVQAKLTESFTEKMTVLYAEQQAITHENTELKQKLADLKYQHNELQKTLNYTESQLKNHLGKSDGIKE